MFALIAYGVILFSTQNVTMLKKSCGNELFRIELISNLPDDNKFDHECENCQREFEVYVEFEPIYSANRIEYIKCEICGKETRDVVKRGYICPYPKNIKEDNICQSCWRKLILKERQLK